MSGDVEMEEEGDEERKLDEGSSFHLGMIAPEIAPNSSTGCMGLWAETVDGAFRAGTGRDTLFLALPFSFSSCPFSRCNASLHSVSLSFLRSLSTSLGIGMGIVPVIHTGPGPCSEAPV